MSAGNESTPEPPGLREMLHDLWLRIHLRRFDGNNYGDEPRPDYVSPVRPPDIWYAGIQKAEHIVMSYAREHGISRVYDRVERDLPNFDEGEEPPSSPAAAELHARIADAVFRAINTGYGTDERHHLLANAAATEVAYGRRFPISLGRFFGNAEATRHDDGVYEAAQSLVDAVTAEEPVRIRRAAEALDYLLARARGRA